MSAQSSRRLGLARHLAGIGLLMWGALAAQAKADEPGTPGTAPALAGQAACRPGAADPASFDAGNLIGLMYQLVSGPADAPRDWQRFGSVFAEGARITVTQHRGDALLADTMTPEQFAQLNQRLFAGRGFFERELARRTDRFGHLAQVWSSYESRANEAGPVYARGINSFQLLNDGKHWCVLSISWDGENAAHPLPVDMAG